MMIGACELAEHLKKNYSNLKIGFIGSHASALPHEIIELSYIDFVFINEGVMGLNKFISGSVSFTKTFMKKNSESSL